MILSRTGEGHRCGGKVGGGVHTAGTFPSAARERVSGSDVCALDCARWLSAVKVHSRGDTFPSATRERVSGGDVCVRDCVRWLSGVKVQSRGDFSGLVCGHSLDGLCASVW